ncbi:3-dehydroquinate synthase II [Stigmatella sp. ncwal1]|uniref:3-dehydroquinate synthase II n=1 Tax=Stigmatella ashevillensis TaxID=2995309 RepID=A0ABT5DKH7_9BACT|nr:3-dehydroquinate synthase II [Stigmatella ashevillena]MDC0713630.1 3-dehydroquinate synthase II [Stigmatella ashevillena]
MTLDITNGYSRTRQEDLAALRKPIRLEAMAGNAKGGKQAQTQIWFDTKDFSAPQDHQGLLLRLGRFHYTGVLLHPRNLEALLPAIPGGLKVAVRLESMGELEALLTAGTDQEILRRFQAPLIAVSPHQGLLTRAGEAGLSTCVYQYVDDGESLHRSIQQGFHHPFLMICFRDPTNIPLELVIASLQATGTTLIKEIANPNHVDDAIVTLGVMEVGADGVMFSPIEHERLEGFARRLAERGQEHVTLEPATVTKSEPVGMGFRSCIDLATLFEPTEGMIVGSTSQGGVLCCPEVFFLPYMETRPFRVNAGGVHSYVYNAANRTHYMSELNAGSSVMIVSSNGATRQAPVGRMKTETRPLRLIEARFASGETINVLLQDDWHVRVFSPEAKPLNITELRPGDQILAHKAVPGRHVGIKIDENIKES